MYYLTFCEGLWLRSRRQDRVDLFHAEHGFVAELKTHHLFVVTTVAKCQQDLSKYLKKELRHVKASAEIWSTYVPFDGDPLYD